MDDYIAYNSKVSVAVFAYNSERTVIETLNSIRDQTYRNIELIINDDCSNDRTVFIVQKWLDENKNIKARLHKNERNLGLNKSFNTLLEQVESEWIKVIAADDILLPDCIENNVKYVKENDINTALFSIHKVFVDKGRNKEIQGIDLTRVAYTDYVLKKNAAKQYKEIIKQDTSFTPTGFYNVKLLKKIGGTSECVKNIEDWPLRLNIVKNGYKMYFMDKVTVLYRFGDSISNSKEGYINSRFVKEQRDLKETIIYPVISKWDVIYWEGELISRFQTWIVLNVLRNKNTRFTKIVSRVIAAANLEKVRRRIKCKIIEKRYIAQNGDLYASKEY